jgi:hypothetical protein
MASILAADASQLFPRAMNDLVIEASVEAKSANIEESRLPQVHALNCIKEFFTTSRLNVASEAFIGQGLELAARTLNSNVSVPSRKIETQSLLTVLKLANTKLQSHAVQSTDRTAAR